MFHAGLALEFSKIIWDDRRAEATSGRGRSERGRSGRTLSGRTSSRMRQEGAPAGGHVSVATGNAGEDPWWAWRWVEPDAEYLRRRAA
jgi:hypothetical protein